MKPLINPMNKYCFKASCRLLSSRPVATFVVYGKTPYTVTKDAADACEIYRRDYTDVRASVCEPVQLVFMEECPVECGTIQMIPESKGNVHMD